MFRASSSLALIFFASLCCASDWLADDPFLQMLAQDQGDNDPLINTLMEHPILERLRGIDQSGIVHYTNGVPEYSRYVHSVGVYLLVKRFGGSRTEQIAALLHDTSHTVFSHVGDLVFGEGQTAHAYQDRIHEWYLRQNGLDLVLQHGGLHVLDVLPDRVEFKRLEQDLPNVCADRLEYTLHTAILLDLMSVAEAENVLNALTFEDGSWVFEDQRHARRVGMTSLFLTQNLFTAPWNEVVYHWTARALRLSIEAGILQETELHQDTDQQVLEVLQAVDHPQISELWGRLRRPRAHFVLASEEFDHHFVSKFRGIDPLVRSKEGVVRLSTVDPLYQQMYCHVRDICDLGWKVRWQST